MHAFGKILKIEAKLYLRDVANLIFVVALPTLVLVILGLVPALRRPDPQFDGQSFVTYFAPSLLVITLATAGVNVLPTVLATYRERGVLRRLATTPASPAALLAAQLVVTLAAIIVSAVLVLVVGRLAFGVPLPRNVPGFTATFIIGTGALLALGLLIAAVARTTRTASAMAVPLFGLCMFFGGVYLPRFLLPDLLARVGDFFPPGVQPLLDAWTGTAPDPLPLAIMAAVAVAAGAAAARLFRWE